MFFDIDNLPLNLSRAVAICNSGTFWTAIAAISAGISAFLTYLSSKNAKKTAENNLKISLYKERYNNIYKLFFDEIERVSRKFLSQDNLYKGIEEDKNLAQQFCQKLDYARFLIHENDFQEILKIYNEIYLSLVDHHTQYTSLPGCEFKITEKFFNDRKVLIDNINKQKSRFANIMIHYLQIDSKSVEKCRGVND